MFFFTNIYLKKTIHFFIFNESKKAKTKIDLIIVEFKFKV